MVLQPLVENAIKHGPDASDEPVHIHVQAERRGELLKLMVSDNGKGCSDVLKAVTNGGIGLRNVRDRLQLLYGDQAHFDISSPQGRGFNVTLSFPLERDLP
jgi:sensor histidine kinase YesM